MAFETNLGNAFAGVFTASRGGLGQTFGIGGKLYPATVQDVGGDTVADLALGVGNNAANADYHTVRYSPAARSTDDTTTVPAIAEGDVLTITAQGPDKYRVVDVEAPTVGGVTHTIVLTVEREAAANSATAAPAGETNAGQIKVFDRPQNPL